MIGPLLWVAGFGLATGFALAYVACQEQITRAERKALEDTKDYREEILRLRTQVANLIGR